MIDTHCHLDLEAFDADRAEVLARARTRGVVGVLVPAIRPRTWATLCALAMHHAGDGVRIAIGVHPQVVPELDADERARLAEDRIDATLHAALDTAGCAAVAVGECGLDGGTADRAEQVRLLRAHVRVARARNLPLIVHVLRAHDDAPRVLREAGAHHVGGVLHSYSGGAALVPIYRALGFHFSFAGPITYPGARRPLEAARVIPAALLLTESDAPDQAPAPHRGTRCEPHMVADVVAGLAAARDEAIADVAAYTAANARRLFATW